MCLRYTPRASRRSLQSRGSSGARDRPPGRVGQIISPWRRLPPKSLSHLARPAQLRAGSRWPSPSALERPQPWTLVLHGHRLRRHPAAQAEGIRAHAPLQCSRYAHLRWCSLWRVTVAPAQPSGLAELGLLGLVALGARPRALLRASAARPRAFLRPQVAHPAVPVRVPPAPLLQAAARPRMPAAL